MPHLEHVLACICRGDLNRLITLLKKVPSQVNGTDEEGISLVQYAVLQDQLEILIYLSNIPDCHLSQKDLHYEHTPLIVACMHENVKMVQQLLHKLTPAEINIQDKFGWTALHHASRNGNVDICKLLLRYQAKVELRNELGKTAVHYAAQHGYLEVVKLLYDQVQLAITPSPLESDKLPTSQEEGIGDNVTREASKAVEKKFALPVLTLLHLAAMKDHTSIVEWLQYKLYPPNIRCRRALHQNGDITCEEFPEDTANTRGHLVMKANLQTYRTYYDTWVQDITSDHSPLDHVKLCLCGPVNSGKTTLRDVLEKGHIQLLLGWDLDDSSRSPDKKKLTYGIEISSLHLSSRDTFHVWDFSGDINNYFTHNYFFTTEHTAYVVVLDISKSTEEFKSELLYWLSLIKMHNLGQKTVYENRPHTDTIPLTTKQQGKECLERNRAVSVPQQPTFRSRLYTATSALKPLKLSRSTSPNPPLRYTSGSVSTSPPSEPISSDPFAPPKSSSYHVTPVPVVVVGSHFDCLSASDKSGCVAKVEEIIRETSLKYSHTLDIVPQVFPVSGDKPNSTEIKYLKEQLSCVRNVIMENGQLFPGIFDKVAKKIISMKLESPDTKVIQFCEFCEKIQSQVNRLLSERQIAYILKCLTNSGLIIYIERGALCQWVFIDPIWLCHNVLGHVLAPQTYPSSLSFGNSCVSEQDITSQLLACTDRFHSTVVLQLLHHFELCFKSRNKPGMLEFPFLLPANETNNVWSSDTRFQSYIGRALTCCNESDFLPPGFISTLQVQVSSSLQMEDLHFFRNALIVNCRTYQCLMKLGTDNCSIEFIGRIINRESAVNCLNLVDQVQSLMNKQSRLMCPSVFFNWSILSATDLQDHVSFPQRYSISLVIDVDRHGSTLWNNRKRVSETPVQVMFFGDEKIKEKESRRNAKVIFLQDSLFEKLELLLADQPGWKELAKHLNLSEYIEILEGQKTPAKSLILKWGEKPRWTVDSLLYALQDIGRRDVYDFVRSKTDQKYEIQ